MNLLRARASHQLHILWQVSNYKTHKSVSGTRWLFAAHETIQGMSYNKIRELLFQKRQEKSTHVICEGRVPLSVCVVLSLALGSTVNSTNEMGRKSSQSRRNIGRNQAPGCKRTTLYTCPPLQKQTQTQYTTAQRKCRDIASKASFKAPLKSAAGCECFPQQFMTESTNLSTPAALTCVGLFFINFFFFCLRQGYVQARLAKKSLSQHSVYNAPMSAHTHTHTRLFRCAS